MTDQPFQLKISKDDLLGAISRSDPPPWWNTHGFKMHVKEFDQKQGKLVIKSRQTAAVVVTRNTDFNGWTVYWTIIHGPSSSVSGQTVMSNAALAGAFGLSSYTGRGSEGLIIHYKATDGEQRTFIRSGNYLNIPCPGTSQDGDPNISLFLDDDIKAMVSLLLNNSQGA